MSQSAVVDGSGTAQFSAEQSTKLGNIDYFLNLAVCFSVLESIMWFGISILTVNKTRH